MGRSGKRKQPILTIEVFSMSDQSTEIGFSGSGDFQSRTFRIEDFGYRSLPEHFERYSSALENLKRKFGKGDKQEQPSELKEAIKELSNGTSYLYNYLFRRRNDVYVDIVNHLRNHIPTSDPRRGEDVNVIEVRASSIKHIIPIECLVMPDHSLGLEIKEKKDVVRATLNVLGFSFIINRVVTHMERVSQKRELCNVPALPLKQFYDGSLEGAGYECDFFKGKRFGRYFRLDGPWPERGSDFEAEDVVRYFYRPDLGFGQVIQAEAIGRQSDEIHHLSCHCYTDENASWRSFLRFTDRLKVSLEEMQSHLPHLKFREYSDKEMPLIFLNACGGSKISPEGMTSFPDYFLNDNQNCGFIGSETNIPDPFAAEFSQEFYLNLIRGFTIGEALFWARHTMLNRYNNPLGILYTFYGDPYLRVTKKADDL